VNPAWVVPTARAIAWEPTAGVATCLALVTAVAALSGTWPVGVLGIAAAALAAALVAGMRDPAAALLAAVPTSAARRRARRQALLVPVGLALWLACVGTARQWEPGVGWPLGTVTALGATGFAVVAWAPDRIALEAGVATPLVWYAAARAGGLDQGPAGLLFAWQHHPWIVTTAALTALLMGRNR
jgi:hypothetical protein